MRIALALVVVAACSKGSKDGGKVASCYAESLHSCVEYRGGNLALGSAGLAKLCTTVVASAVFSEQPCRTANTISTCQRNEGKDFYYTGYEGNSDQATCTERGGKFATE